MIEVVGRAEGTDPISGTFVEDPWMRVREIHFPPKETAELVVITFTGEKGGIIRGDGADPGSGTSVKIGKVNIYPGGFPVVVTTWTFDGPVGSTFDELSSLRAGPFFDAAHIRDDGSQFPYFLDGNQVKAMLLSQYPGSTWVKGVPQHVRPSEFDDDPTHGFDICTFFVWNVDKSQDEDRYRTTYVLTLTDDTPDENVVGFFRHTGKAPGPNYNTSTTTLVQVDAYSQKPPDPSNPLFDDPGNPGLLLKITVNPDATVELLNAKKEWSYSTGWPDRVAFDATPPADVFVKFNKKGVVS